MSQAVALTINFSDPSSSPEEEWWLTIVQTSGDDRVTVQEAAEILDDLYDNDPCIAEETEEETEEVTEDDLTAALSEVDIEQCKLLTSGDYTTELTIVKSHPHEPHKLTLSVGEASSTVIEQFDTSQTLDVEASSSVSLPYPVLDPANLTASWRGTVYGTLGAIDPPSLKYAHNTIYWDTQATGTIRAEYLTKHEIVTVTISVVVESEDDLIGETQESNALVFYHYQTYQCTIEPPERDDGWDTELSTVCGWDDGSSGGDTDTDPGSDDQPTPEDACPGGYYTPGSLANPGCCVDTNNGGTVCCDDLDKPPCLEWMTGKIPTKSLSPAIQAAYPGASFIAMPTDPINGCGRKFEQWAFSENCCSKFDPLTAHSDNPTEISSNSSAVVCVLGGADKLKWTAGGGLYFHDAYGNHVTTLITLNHHPECVNVYAPAEFCANSKIQVEDGCSFLSMNLHKPDAVPLSITVEPPDEGFTPGITWLRVEGGTPPYSLTTTGQHTHFVNGEKSIETGPGLVQLYILADQLCAGSFEVMVYDSCVAYDSADINMSEVPIGTTCFRYTSGYQSLADWGGNGAPIELAIPILLKYTGVAQIFTTVSAACDSPDWGVVPVGTFFLLPGGVEAQAARVVVGTPYTTAQGYCNQDLVYTFFSGVTEIIDPCEICV